MGLGAIKDAWDHILGTNTILACDPQIAKAPGDISRGCIQTGYPHLDVETALDPELDRFLEQGSRPVYAGFGSLPPWDQKRNFPRVLAAARSLGRRVIINQYWAEKPEQVMNERTAPDVFFIRQAPHLRLFPKIAAVIHHGGAGTTAAAAVSGVPQVIVPHILDQYYNGQQVYKNKLGPKPIQKSQLTQKKLEKALDTCLTDPVIQTQVENTRTAIDPEMSLARIVRTIVLD
jgi:UDP:flavonoid glycosyltransferase YjiC (YdhE family)